MGIKLIIGIGNIGSKYNNTRHNFGHTYVQLLAKKYKVRLNKNYDLSGYVGKLKIQENSTTRLFIPCTYMNNSGYSVSQCVQYYQLSTQEILVAHDELDLSPGIVRIKLGKTIRESHRGVQDIINKLNGNFNFYRLRIGIGRPVNKSEIINFVLNQPNDYERTKIHFVINKIILYTEDIIHSNFDIIMNKLHAF